MAAAAEALQLAQAEKKATADQQSQCGAGKEFWSRWCFYAGAFLASASLTGIDHQSLHAGQTAHALVSAAIPVAGLRWALNKKANVSLDLGALSMLISKDISSNGGHSACRSADGEYEKHLPCVGSATITPIVGGYLGLTIGTSDLGLITIMPTIGLATTSLDDGRYFYEGIAVGLINVAKVINP
jgi:hypothetical protein